MAEKDKAEERAVDVPDKATPLGPGKPVGVQAVTQMGGTFAERAAAAKGKKVTPQKPGTFENSTFGSRGKAVKSAETEDKSVKGSTTKKG